MVSSRTVTAVAGLLVGLAVSVVVWYAFGQVFLFFFVPFVPFLFRRRADRPPVRRCPTCGFETRDSDYEFCPRDGTPLE
ncbi:hypothetical protein ACFQH6_11005 [Halobacteriaceae archaeon GCM10025711]